MYMTVLLHYTTIIQHKPSGTVALALIVCKIQTHTYISHATPQNTHRQYPLVGYV